MDVRPLFREGRRVAAVTVGASQTDVGAAVHVANTGVAGDAALALEGCSGGRLVRQILARVALVLMGYRERIGRLHWGQRPDLLGSCSGREDAGQETYRQRRNGNPFCGEPGRPTRRHATHHLHAVNSISRFGPRQDTEFARNSQTRAITSLLWGPSRPVGLGEGCLLKKKGARSVKRAPRSAKWSLGDQVPLS